MARETAAQREQNRVNQQIMDELRETYENAELRRMDRDSAVYAIDFNNEVLQRENINPDDGIPAYVQNLLMPTGDATVTDDDLEQSLENDLKKVYGDAFEVRTQLTPATRNALGDDYVKFETEHLQNRSVSRMTAMDMPSGDTKPAMHNGRRLPDGFSNVYDESDDWSFDERN